MRLHLLPTAMRLHHAALIALLIAPVLAQRRQEGCARFSYLSPRAQVPVRYHCQPEPDTSLIRPRFVSTRFDDPGYCQLSPFCPCEIRRGADDEAAIGAFHDLYEPQREEHLRARLDEYLRFGLEAGIFFEPRIESRAVVAHPYGYGAAADLCGDEMEQLPGIGAGLI